jgi:acyl-coenzyme A synthetase/AMP-(fatty) acid ligase
VEAVLGYLGCLRSRTPCALFSANLHGSHLSTLLDSYRPPYIWLPRERAAEIPSASELYRFGGFVLLSTDFPPLPADDALALLVTTSGSTGSPKLVRLSYGNLAANATSIAQYLQIRENDRAVTSLPMHYVYGLSVINSHLQVGAAIVLTNASIAEQRFWSLLERHGVTSISGVPYTYELLHKLRWQRMNLGSLNTLTQAGGKLHPDLVRKFAVACDAVGIRFYVMYGAAEATARMSYLPPEMATTYPGSIGIPIPGGDLWIQDDSGRVIREAGVTGELFYRGPNVSLGYATCGADLARGDERGGVLPTGDLAQRCENNLYSIVGRRKRFLKLFGNRINLEEVEQFVRNMGVECACGGDDDILRIYITDMRWREDVLSAVRETTRLHPSALHVVVLEQIPRNSFGKIAYAELP